MNLSRKEIKHIARELFRDGFVHKSYTELEPKYNPLDALLILCEMLKLDNRPRTNIDFLVPFARLGISVDTLPTIFLTPQQIEHQRRTYIKLQARIAAVRRKVPPGGE